VRHQLWKTKLCSYVPVTFVVVQQILCEIESFPATIQQMSLVLQLNNGTSSEISTNAKENWSKGKQNT
jgi:hypothetical protein